MGIIKFEVDIPDFENELQINIVLKKDGEVIDKKTSSSIPPRSIETKSEKKPVKKSTTKPTSSLLGNGNMMDLDV